MMYYDREHKTLANERESADKMTKFLYKTTTGRTLLKVFVARPAFSKKMTGENPWKINEIEKICEVLNKNYYELFRKKI